MVERPLNDSLLDEISAGIIGKLHHFDPGTRKHPLRFIGKKQQRDIPWRIVAIERRRKLHIRIDVCTERDGTTNFVADI